MKNNILEKLAEIEHDQWIEWSKDVASKENISEDRKKRWEKYWVPYSELSEEVKEQDRKYARKILKALSNYKPS